MYSVLVVNKNSNIENMIYEINNFILLNTPNTSKGVTVNYTQKKTGNLSLPFKNQ
jgi:hypothetical protein